MTEYDYSPEAYQRYLATQTRIANWVDKTEQHRPQFQHAVPAAPIADAPLEPSSSSHSRQRRHHHPGQSQPRQLFIHVPAPGSDSSDDYADGPGPMPLSAPAMMYSGPSQQPMFQPMVAPMGGQPMLTPPPMMMPPTFAIPPHRSSHHHRSHSRARSRHHSPGYYSMASPPVSPGYQYAFPGAPMAGGHPGYIMMPPQHHRAQQVPMMSDVSQPPRPATAFVSTAQGTSSASGGYFQQQHHLHPASASASFPPGPVQSPTTSPWSTHGGGSSATHSYSQSALSTPTGSISVGLASPPQTQGLMSSYFLPPQYQSMSSAAMASSSFLGVPPPQLQLQASPHSYLQRPPMPSAQAYLHPQGLHQRVYDTSSGSTSRHYLRHSVG